MVVKFVQVKTKIKFTRQEQLFCCLTSSVARGEDYSTIKSLAHIYCCKQFAWMLIGMVEEHTSYKKVQS